MPPLKLCLDCGRPAPGNRCTDCKRIKNRATLTDKRSRRPAATAAEIRRRADVVTAHRRVHGDWCPGWRCDPHPATDLTADHIEPVAAGGAESGALAVLCRRCNSRKGAKT